VTTLLVSCLALVSGSIPTGVLLTRAITGIDVRAAGSGNIGAANVARTAGFKVGVGVAALDTLKGVLPVLAGRALGLDNIALAIVALAAVLGHDYSLFLRFRGGKGVATTLGVMLALAPVPTILALLTYVAIALALRYSSLASLSALTVLPAYMAALGQPRAFVVLAAILWLIAMVKHRENIVRLVHGTESRFTLHGR
jgi:acyl phosphate:glycerol-3-phosphate acyltransferase